MADPNASRRFDEKEFALILRKAAEIQHDVSRHVRSGLTLQEIEGIAAEAGIEPKHVRQAALDLTTSVPGVWQRMAGPPTHIHTRRTVAGELGPEALAAIVDVAQAELGRPGAAREVLGGLEWVGRDSMGPVQITARPQAGETRIQVSTDRKEAAAVLATLLPIAGLILGGVAGGALDAVPVVVAVGGGVAGGLVAARALWNGVVNRWQRRVGVIMDRVVAAADSARSETSLKSG